MAKLIKLGIVRECSTGKYLSLIAIKHQGGSRTLKRKFDARDEAEEYLRIFEKKFYGIYGKKYYRKEK